MKRTVLLKTKPCTAPDQQTDDVLAKCQLLMDGDREILNVDLFHEGVLKARYFANKTESTYYTHINEKWKSNALSNIAREILNFDIKRGEEPYYSDKKWEYDTEDDKKTAEHYLKQKISYWEQNCRSDKYSKAQVRKQDRIDKLMNTVPTVPQEAEQWILQELFPQNYLFVKDQKKRTVYSCTACGIKSWKKITFKHGTNILCPKCGAPVKVEKKRDVITKKAPVVIVQIVNDQTWVERQFYTECTWQNSGKELEMFEDIRAMIPVAETWGKVYYGLHHHEDEFIQEFWDKNQGNKQWRISYLYPGNLSEVLPFAGLERSGLDAMALKKQKFDVNKYVCTANRRPWLEYMAKGGFTQLAADIVHQYGWWSEPDCIYKQEHTVKGVLNLNADRVHRMKKLSGGLNILKWLQYEEQSQRMGSHVRITEESLNYLTNKNVSMDSCMEILKELGSVNRMVNYMKKQKISPNEFMTTWRDYLRMAANEGLDTSDDIVRLPKDLKKRHDQLVEKINIRNQQKRIKKKQEKYDKLDAQIKELSSWIKPFIWEDDRYKIIPATKCEEVMDEGRQLHHCVGSSDFYMEKMASGKSWILFMRKKTELEESYYTIEVDLKDCTILQWYSMFDRKPNKNEVGKVLNNWINTVKKKTEKMPARA